MSKNSDFFCTATQAYIEKRHWNVGRIIAEEMKPLQFEEIEDIAALIPEAELIIDYPRLDSMDDIRRILDDSASTVRLAIKTKLIRIEVFLPQLYPLVGDPEFQIFSEVLTISALKRIRKSVACQFHLTKIGGSNTGQGVLLEQINFILDAAHNAQQEN